MFNVLRWLHDDGFDPKSEQILRLKILEYLDLSGQLKQMETEGMNYRDEILKLRSTGKDYRAPFTVCLRLDLLRIADNCDELGLLIMEKPLVARRLVKDVVLCSLVTLCDLPLVESDQIQVLLRVDALPATQGLRITGAQLQDTCCGRLLFLQGVIVAFSSCNKYIRSAEFRCGTSTCPGRAARRICGQAVRRARCRFCDAAMDEAKQGRDMGDEVFAAITDPSALQPTGPTVAHPVTVRFTDDLVHELELGQRYDLVLVQDGAWLEVWGVQPWRGPAQRRVELGIRSDPLPPAVQNVWIELQSRTEMSPWSFAVALAAQLGGSRYPQHAFLHLKLGILLSLASQGLEHPPLPLLALGPEPAGQELLGVGLRLSARGVAVTGSALGEPPSGSLRTSAPDSNWITAGPLLLASGGVCLLGCWAKWRRSAAARSVRAALESGWVTLESRSARGASARVPIRCGVWTYWSPSNSPADTAELRTLLDTLGVPLLSDCGCDPADVAGHVMRAALQQPQPRTKLPEVSADQLSQFLALVNAQPVSLSEEASRLIQDYFVASRRVRPNCLPVTAVSTMVTLAEVLARVSLRREATWADVLLVVWMYEVALTALFGPCQVYPLPPDAGLPLRAQDVIDQMDARMKKMKAWLDNLTQSVFLSSLKVFPSDNDC